MLRHAPFLARGLVLVFALALAASGLGHRFASAAELERAQYAQIFGAELCVTGDGETAPDAAGCPVCHLIGALYLPDAVTGAAVPVFALLVQGGTAGGHLLRTATSVALPGQRGPPLS